MRTCAPRAAVYVFAPGCGRDPNPGPGERMATPKKRRKVGERKPPVQKARKQPDRGDEIASMRAHLLDKRESLLRGMHRDLENQEAPLTKGDTSDLAADALDSDTSLQLAESGSTEIAQIDEALRKMQEGTYGECELCGKEIPWSRLEALPYATTCIACKQRQELEGGGEGGGWDAMDELEDAETQE